MTARIIVIVRRAARWHGITEPLPVVVVSGNRRPHVMGERWHHVTPSGDVCHHPSAYRKAFGRPIYVASTRRIAVGAAWLRRVVGGVA